MEQFWNNIVSAVADNAVSFCLTVLGAILALVIGFRLIKLLLRLIEKTKFYARLDPTARPFITSVANVALKILLIVTAAGIVGVPTASLIAVLGSAGVAIGLALQGSLTNLAGGVMIIFYKPFKRGDIVEFPNTGEPMGRVSDISAFYTTIEAFDNRVLVIPNGTVSNSPIINYTARELRRVDIEFHIEYSQDPQKARELILSAAGGCKAVLSDPAPYVIMTKMLDSSVVMRYSGYCKAADALGAECDIMELVKKAFDENGMTIPFPQMDVHVKP